MRGPAHTPGARLLAVLAAALLGLAAAAAASASPSATPAQLRAQAAIQKARQAAAANAERTALLDLYSLETALGRARADLAALKAQIAGLARQEADARHRLAIARATVTRTEAALAQEIRVLYERGEPNAIAVLLGSESLDSAIEELDSIESSTKDHRRIIEQTLRARKQAKALAASLAQRQRTLRSVQARRAAAIARLAAARDSRAAYVRTLRERRHLAAAQVASLESQAAAAEAKSRELAAQAAARERARLAAAQAAARAAAAKAAARSGATAATTAGAAPSATATEPATSTAATATTVDGSSGSLPSDGASAPAAPGDRTLTVSITAYSIHGRTATGLPTGWGIVAVDPAVIPLGTKMTIPGYGEAIAADTGPGVRGASIDVWVPDYASAAAFGRRTVTIVLH